MQCSSGAGTPLPGKWTGLSQPPVHQTLPPAPRHSCIFEENGSKFDSETSKQPSRRDTDSEEEERFRKRFWSEEDKRRKRKRSSIDLKRSELKRSWLGRNLVSISPTFYAKLLRVQIPKAQNIQSSHQSFFALLGSVCLKAGSKTLVKSTPG